MPDTLQSSPRTAEARVGTVVGHKYLVEKVLGAGGMATVYAAVHRNGHRVALKILHPLVAADADLRARFVREGYVANQVDHPGVVKVLDDDETGDGSVFLVMELLDGETVHARARRRGGRLKPREVLAIGYQALDVLAATHARGILHRDIKPENLFLTRQGQLRVLDFGIARVQAQLAAVDPTRTGRALGTPAFMPPEQAFGRTAEVDVRSDVWACGATLFTLTSGEHVHDATNVSELMVYAATKPARSLASVAPEAPAALTRIVDRALAFEPGARWASAADMRAAIAEAFASIHGAPLSEESARAALGPTAAEAAATLDSRSMPALARSPSRDSAAARERTTAPRALSRGPGWTALLAGATALAIGAGVLLLRGHPGEPRVRAAAAAASAGGTASPGAPTGSRPACAVNADCAGGGRAVCRAGSCVALEGPGCRLLARDEDVRSDATIWIGAMFADSGPRKVDFEESVRAVDLARRDFLEVADGLPSPRLGEPPRPLAVVLCDDAENPLRSARHLVDDLGVPAILGFMDSKEVLDLASAVFNPRGVLALASNTSTLLRSIATPPGGPRFVWRTTTAATMLVPAESALVRDVLEPAVHHDVGPMAEIRVAVLNYDNAAGIGMSDAIVSSLRFNGQSVAENGERYRELRFTGHPGPAERARLVREVVEFAPHVILEELSTDEILAEIEDAWPPGAAFRPRYVGSTLVARRLLSRAGSDASLRRRVFGVETPTTTPAVAKFVVRHDAVFSPPVDPLDAVDAPYDAFYALAYAIAAAGNAPLTGATLARALARLSPPGEHIDVGEAGILAALAALARGENVDLQGTTTSLDFDPATGDPTADFAVFCLRAGPRGEAVSKESGLVWDGRRAAWVGKMRCD